MAPCRRCPLGRFHFNELDGEGNIADIQAGHSTPVAIMQSIKIRILKSRPTFFVTMKDSVTRGRDCSYGRGGSVQGPCGRSRRPSYYGVCHVLATTLYTMGRSTNSVD